MSEQIVTLFKALGEPTRLKIVKLLSQQELCVCELEAILDMSQPRVSQHLKVLKNAGLVQERKQRQRSFFSLDTAIAKGDLKVFTAYMTADIREVPQLAAECQRLTELEQNEDVKRCKQGQDGRSL